jgi:hypothetical protein
MTPNTLNIVLRGLELMPHGQAKEAYAEIERQIVPQFQAPAGVPGTSKNPKKNK